jgi:hypothetical protein
VNTVYTYDGKDIDTLTQEELLTALKECINALLWRDYHHIEEIRHIRQTYGQRENLPELPSEPPREEKRRYGIRQK